MAVLTGVGVLDSFSEVIPSAANQHEAYLRAIADHVSKQGLPVEMALEAINAGSLFNQQSRQCLAIIPNGKRLRHFKTLHYGTPIGVNLAVGWYLLGGERLGGTDIGAFNFGGLNALELADMQAIVQCVHQFAVSPAMYAVADAVSYDRGELHQKRGFFGT